MLNIYNVNKQIKMIEQQSKSYNHQKYKVNVYIMNKRNQNLVVN